MHRNLAGLERNSFDLIIVGGGIYGACVAWDAVLRGLSVALLEKEDFGHATSANSMKTVHGGLRYLQQLDIKRMRESIKERTTLMRIAPHLVHPLPFLLPTYGHSLKGKEAMAIALLLNDLISFDRNRLTDPHKHLPRGRTIARKECLKLLPDIEKDGLTGGAIWYDAQMYNSERLTLSFLHSAADRGAVVTNYVKVKGFLQEGTRVVGVQAIDMLEGNEIEIRARTVVNTAGPWVNQVLDYVHGNGRQPQVAVRFAKAINLVTRPLLGSYAVGISVKNNSNDTGHKSGKRNRLLFVVPWRNHSLIGTAYIPFDGNPGHLRVTEQEIQTLVQDVNQAVPTVGLQREDILYVHAGLVPISGMDPKRGTVRRARHYQIRDHRVEGIEGLISVMGVKYTTARGVAEKVVDRVFETWGYTPPPSCSSTTHLHGGRIARFTDFLEGEISKQPHSLKEDTLRPLLYNYGSAYRDVLNYFDRNVDVDKPLTDSRALLRAETIHAIRHEMAKKLTDVVFRRTELGAAGPPDAGTLAFCAKVMGVELNWNPAQVQQELQEVNAALLTLNPCNGDCRGTSLSLPI